MTQIPEDIIFYARHLLNDDVYQSDADLQEQLNDRRDAAIRAIQWYRDLKKRVAARDKARKEITEWLKENNIPVIPERVRQESIIMEIKNNA